MTSYYLTGVVQLFYNCYALLLFTRIVLSWVPAWQSHTMARFVAFCTDPYLNIFRRFLPPLGGVLDLSPLLAFFMLGVIKMIILWLIGLIG
jgi:YggT family protein